MLHYFPFSVCLLSPLKNAAWIFTIAFNGKQFFVKKNRRWMKLNKRKMESVLFLLTLNCPNVTV